MNRRFTTRSLRSLSAVIGALVLLLSVAAFADVAQQTRFSQIDLSRFSLAPSANATSIWRSMPLGNQSLAGIPWSIGAYLPLTGMDAARSGIFYPADAIGIPIGRKVDRFHLLHALLQPEKDGRPVASIVLHFADGSRESIRLAFGVHVRDAVTAADPQAAELPDPNSHLVWRASEPVPLCLFATAFDNPHPDQSVMTVDFVSLFSRSTPLMAALTLEENPSEKLAPIVENRITRKSKELGDDAFRRGMRLRIVATETKQPLPGSIISVAIKDDTKLFLFGKYSANSAGLATVPYPQQDAVELSLAVQSPGFVSGTTNIALLDLGDASAEVSIALQKGRTVGGIVVNSAGAPIAGAAITVFETIHTDTAPSRRNLDLVYSGPDGKWLCTARESTLTNLAFEVSHEAHRSVTYEHLNLSDLIATNAFLAMKPYPRVAGKVSDATARQFKAPPSCFCAAKPNSLFNRPTPMASSPSTSKNWRLTMPSSSPPQILSQRLFHYPNSL